MCQQARSSERKSRNPGPQRFARHLGHWRGLGLCVPLICPGVLQTQPASVRLPQASGRNHLWPPIAAPTATVRNCSACSATSARGPVTAVSGDRRLPSAAEAPMPAGTRRRPARRVTLSYPRSTSRLLELQTRCLPFTTYCIGGFRAPALPPRTFSDRHVLCSFAGLIRRSGF